MGNPAIQEEAEVVDLEEARERLHGAETNGKLIAAVYDAMLEDTMFVTELTPTRAGVCVQLIRPDGSRPFSALLNRIKQVRPATKKLPGLYMIETQGSRNGPKLALFSQEQINTYRKATRRPTR